MLGQARFCVHTSVFIWHRAPQSLLATRPVIKIQISNKRYHVSLIAVDLALLRQGSIDRNGEQNAALPDLNRDTWCQISSEERRDEYFFYNKEATNPSLTHHFLTQPNLTALLSAHLATYALDLIWQYQIWLPILISPSRVALMRIVHVKRCNARRG